MPKKLFTIFLSLCVLLAGCAGVYYLYQTQVKDCVIRASNSNPLSNCVTFERLETREQRIKGLSGRESLEPTRAMLFVFDTPGRQCIWMKDMKFNIDITWLDKEGIITHSERNVSPDTYPKSFCGGTQDKYVIETMAGAVDETQLKPGNKLKL